jgi:hypothetical protein
MLPQGYAGYNELFFSGKGLRSYYHFARYRWLRKRVEERTSGPLRIVELGCFDAKSIDFLPPRLESYVGLDANWDNGLDMGRARFAGRPDIKLIECETVDSFARFADGQFNAAISLETLEHIPPKLVDDYLRQIKRVTRGPFFVSVPNEMGPVFLAKHLAKRLRYGTVYSYSFRELVAATLRQSHKVRRDEHKGFDYRVLARQLSKHFDVVSIEGLPGRLPAALSLTVAIVAHSRGTS